MWADARIVRHEAEAPLVAACNAQSNPTTPKAIVLCREVVIADGTPHLGSRLSVHRDNGELAKLNVSATEVVGRVGIKLIILPLRYLDRGYIVSIPLGKPLTLQQVRDSSLVKSILLL